MLYDGTPYDLEVFDGIIVNLKINLREKYPPGIIKFFYNDQENKRDLKVYLSRVSKEPKENDHQGKYINVRLLE